MVGDGSTTKNMASFLKLFCNWTVLSCTFLSLSPHVYVVFEVKDVSTRRKKQLVDAAIQGLKPYFTMADLQHWHEFLNVKHSSFSGAVFSSQSVIWQWWKAVHHFMIARLHHSILHILISHVLSWHCLGNTLVDSDAIGPHCPCDFIDCKVSLTISKKSPRTSSIIHCMPLTSVEFCTYKNQAYAEVAGRHHGPLTCITDAIMNMISSLKDRLICYSKLFDRLPKVWEAMAGKLDARQFLVLDFESDVQIGREAKLWLHVKFALLTQTPVLNHDSNRCWAVWRPR